MKTQLQFCKKAYRWVTAFTLIICAIFELTAQNLALNPGFELGTGNNFENWTNNNNTTATFTATTVAGEFRNGARAVKVVNTLNTPGAAYSTQLSSSLINTPIGSTHRFTVYVKAANAGGKATLSTVSPLNNYGAYSYSGAAFDIGTDWTMITFVTVPAVESQSQFQINLAINANDYFIDDASVTQLTAGTVTTPPVSANLLNPDFELGTGDVFTNWAKQNGGSNMVQTTTPGEFYSGVRGLKVNSDATRPQFSGAFEAYSIQLISDAVATNIGAVYTLKFWAKSALGGTNIRVSTTTNQYINAQTIGTTWQQYTWTFTATGASTGIALDLGLGENTYFIDDLTLTTPLVVVNCINVNGGFENAYNVGMAGEGFNNWGKYNGGAAMSVTAVAAEVKSGARALKAIVPITATAGYQVQLVTDPITTVVGVKYKFSIYAKRAVAGTSTIQLSTNSTTADAYSAPYTPGTDWTLHTFQFTAVDPTTRVALNLGGAGEPTYYLDDACVEVVCDGAWTPPISQTPFATGSTKYLGNVHSAAQVVNSNQFFNQVVPENAGKWGSVEGTRDVFNWTQLDAARKFANDNNFPFRFHVLLWGAQQPTWLKPLSNAEKLEEIKEWFTAVRDRYNATTGDFKKPDFIEVFNETLNDPPNNLNNATTEFQFRSNNTTDAASGDYLDALRSLNTQYGTTPGDYDYIVNAFKLAREIFGCDAKLMINEYGIENDSRVMTTYKGIVDMLKADELIDGVGMQLHSFSTQLYNGYSPANVAAATTNLQTQLTTISSAGLPLLITEMDIDGDVSIDPNSFARVTTGTQAEKDAFQKAEYERIFPIYWNHPSVIGITLWGYRPGHWRSTQAAFLTDQCTGAPRPALTYLESVVRGTPPAAPVAVPDYDCTINQIGGKVNNGVTGGSSGTPYNGTSAALYIKLVQANDVKHVAQVAENGTFTFFKVKDGQYKVILSKTFDQNASAISIPAGLSFNREGLADATSSTYDEIADGSVMVNVANNLMTLVPPITSRIAVAPAFTAGELAFDLAGAPLPVSLISFEAKQFDSKIVLNWKTANELNFSHFEIQKSENLKEFNSIGQIKGTSINYYNFTDHNPNIGLNYYRLKMVDLDGSVEFSPIKSVEFRKDNEYLEVQNPVENGEISVFSNTEITKFELFTTIGKALDIQVIKKDINQYSIKINNLNSGIYFLKTITKNGFKTRKLLVK